MPCRYITFVLLTIAVHGVIALNIDLRIQREVIRKGVAFTVATLEFVPSGPKSIADEAYARERDEHRRATMRQIEADAADAMFPCTDFLTFPTGFFFTGAYDTYGSQRLQELPGGGAVDKGTQEFRKAKLRYMKIGVNSIVSGLLISCFLVPMLIRADRRRSLDRQDGPGNL